MRKSEILSKPACWYLYSLPSSWCRRLFLCGGWSAHNSWVSQLISDLGLGWTRWPLPISLLLIGSATHSDSILLILYFRLIKCLVFAHFLFHNVFHDSTVELLAVLLLYFMKLFWVVHQWLRHLRLLFFVILLSVSQCILWLRHRV